MSKKSESTERSKNIWAPWRIEYINSLSEGEGECFMCRYRDEIEKDKENFVLWRGKRSFAMLNRFPYTGGHTMIAPYDHVGDLDKLDEQTMLEMFGFMRDIQKILTRAIRAHGFNIGMNINRCAGAGLPDHIHLHIVPRWQGDTNFMAVFGGSRVISQSLEELYDLLRKSGEKLNLPKASQ